jgi:hypothetical protein
MITFLIVLASLLLINTFLFLFSRNKEDDQHRPKIDAVDKKPKSHLKRAS